MNALHSVLTWVRMLFILETFFYNMYFLTIVFYFTNKLFLSMFTKRSRSRKPILGLRIGYGVFIGLYVTSVFTSIYI